MSGRELPAGWELVDFDTLVASAQNGLSKRQGDEGTAVPVLRLADFDGRRIAPKEPRKILMTSRERNELSLLQGDLLCVRVNGSESIVGRFGVFRQEGEWSFCDHFIRYRLNSAALSEYVGRFFETDLARHHIESSFVSSAGQKTVNRGIVGSTQVPLAPLPEQRRIVEKVEALTTRSRRAREALDSLPALIDRYRQSILAAAFRGDLTADWRQHKSLTCVPDEYFHSASRRQGSRVTLGEQRAVEADHANMPTSWKKVFVRDVARLQPGYAFKSSWFAKSGVRLLRGTNIVPDGTRWDDTVFLPEDVAADYSGYQLSEGDIIIAMDRPLISSGLKVARVSRNDLPALLLQRVGRFHLSKAIMPEFFWLYLHTFQFIRHILGQATGSDLPHISAADIESAPLYVPSLDEQRKIIEITGEDKLLNAVSASASFARDRLATLDQSILAKAFRGELVPEDPNDEPASVLLERIRAERAAAGATPRRGRRGGGKASA